MTAAEQYSRAAIQLWALLTSRSIGYNDKVAQESRASRERLQQFWGAPGEHWHALYVEALLADMVPRTELYWEMVRRATTWPASPPAQGKLAMPGATASSPPVACEWCGNKANSELCIRCSEEPTCRSSQWRALAVALEDTSLWLVKEALRRAAGLARRLADGDMGGSKGLDSALSEAEDDLGELKTRLIELRRKVSRMLLREGRAS